MGNGPCNCIRAALDKSVQNMTWPTARSSAFQPRPSSVKHLAASATTSAVSRTRPETGSMVFDGQVKEKVTQSSPTPQLPPPTKQSNQPQKAQNMELVPRAAVGGGPTITLFKRTSYSLTVQVHIKMPIPRTERYASRPLTSSSYREKRTIRVKKQNGPTAMASGAPAIFPGQVKGQQPCDQTKPMDLWAKMAELALQFCLFCGKHLPADPWVRPFPFEPDPCLQDLPLHRVHTSEGSDPSDSAITFCFTSAGHPQVDKAGHCQCGRG